MRSPIETLRRLWQPHRGLFWLMVMLQLLSSGIVLFVQITDPPDALRLALGVMALIDALLAWWLVVRLWRESAPAANPS